MKLKYYGRVLEGVLRGSLKKFPAVILTGPRQSGKTTLLRTILSKSHKYVSLETPDLRDLALRDPRAFLNFYEPPVIFDEIQYVPEILPYIKEDIDEHRGKGGRYVLTGSQNLMLLKNVSQTLAGRAAILKLAPFQKQEELMDLHNFLPWERGHRFKISRGYAYGELWKKILRGFYPELVAGKKHDVGLWQSSYVQTYLERDVRSLRQIGDLSTFLVFLRVLASRVGQLINMADISKELGVALNTVKNWFNVLEASFQIVRLRPYYGNVGKRLVKTPKIYFTDTGLVCYLTGIKEARHAHSGPLAGALYENLVVSEIVKRFIHRGEEPVVYFWRTSRGEEVDLVIETKGKLIPVEVKACATPKYSMTDGIRSFMKMYGKKAGKGYVVHTGDEKFPLGSNIEAIPFSGL